MTSAQADWLSAGRVGRPHGLDGSFHVTRPRAVLLAEGAEIRVGERSARIERRAGTDERPIVRLDVAHDREAVAALRGEDLLVHRERLPPLPDGEYWPEDLAGCVVHDAGRRVGVVARMTALPSCEILEVRRDSGGELLVPMVRDAIRAVDVPAREIEIDLAFLGEEEA